MNQPPPPPYTPPEETRGPYYYGGPSQTSAPPQQPSAAAQTTGVWPSSSSAPSSGVMIVSGTPMWSTATTTTTTTTPPPPPLGVGVGVGVGAVGAGVGVSGGGGSGISVGTGWGIALLVLLVVLVIVVVIVIIVNDQKHKSSSKKKKSCSCGNKKCQGSCKSSSSSSSCSTSSSSSLAKKKSGSSCASGPVTITGTRSDIRTACDPENHAGANHTVTLESCEPPTTELVQPPLPGVGPSSVAVSSSLPSPNDVLIASRYVGMTTAVATKKKVVSVRLRGANSSDDDCSPHSPKQCTTPFPPGDPVQALQTLVNTKINQCLNKYVNDSSTAFETKVSVLQTQLLGLVNTPCPKLGRQVQGQVQDWLSKDHKWQQQMSDRVSKYKDKIQRHIIDVLHCRFCKKLAKHSKKTAAQLLNELVAVLHTLTVQLQKDLQQMLVAFLKQTSNDAASLIGCVQDATRSKCLSMTLGNQATAAINAFASSVTSTLNGLLNSMTVCLQQLEASIAAAIRALTIVCPGSCLPCPPCPSCPAPLVSCNSVCTDVKNDPAHCGNCTTVCAAGQVCMQGVCTTCNSSACPAGQTLCSGVCTDTKKDEEHCGDCTTVCATGFRCVNGICVLSCQAGLTNCAGVCTDLKTNEAHCGACGNPCGTGQVCQNGTCVLVCTAGLTPCGAFCYDTKNDPNHCGSCTTQCAANEECVGGVCTSECSEDGLTVCGTQCVNTMNDPNHCGDCVTQCDAQHTCRQGVCVPNCPVNYTFCPTTGLCVDPMTDVKNCNGCDVKCTAGLQPACCAGACDDLSSSNTNCGTCGNGCKTADGFQCCHGRCVNLRTSNCNCNDCDAFCPGGSVCVDGACVCPSGTTLCSGACVPNAVFQTDNANCGQCGTVCLSTERCVNGTCVTCNGGGGGNPTCCGVTCPAGSGLTPCPTAGCACACGPNCNQCGPGEICCNGGCTNCQSFANDVNHCGACNRACNPDPQNNPNPPATCQQGVCVCSTDQTFCDGFGCADLLNDNAHCGSCNRACPPGSTCQNGQCLCFTGQVLLCGGCFPGTMPTAFLTDGGNCGGCGNVCRPGASCVDGVCTCSSGSGNCPTACGADTTSDPQNCGGCSRICAAPPNATATCDNGQCTYRCNEFYGDCDGSSCTGCETKLDTNVNCGGCGVVCPPDATCTLVQLPRQDVYRCVCNNPNHILCDGVCVPNNTTQHCGTCDVNCGPQGTGCVPGGDTGFMCTCQAGYAFCKDTVSGSGLFTCVDATINAHCGPRCSQCNPAGGLDATSCQLNPMSGEYDCYCTDPGSNGDVRCGGFCCLGGNACCDNVCTPVTSDPTNCGGCGVTCGLTCDNGRCTCVPGGGGSECPPEHPSCDGTGHCV